MSTGIETVDIVDPWLWNGITTIPGLGLPVSNVINGASDVLEMTPPYIVFNLQAQRDVQQMAGVRVWANCIYLVKAVVRGGNYDPARTLFRKVDAWLTDEGMHKTHQTAAGDISCVREAIIQYPEVLDGAQYRHLGGRYRILANSH